VDGKLTSECRASAGLCDFADNCNGIGNKCPVDVVEPPTTLCRTAAGVCDAADYCDGASGLCPADGKLTSECRAAAGLCDSAENCNGVGNNCPADLVEPPTTECRASTDACDLAELCDGVGVTCPADNWEPGTTECRAAAGVCDAIEYECPPVVTTCPADAKLTTVCRPSVHVCDADDYCDGVRDYCLFDLPANGLPCPDGDLCNGNEICEGFVCASRPPPDCDDGDTCTADSCDPVAGCINDPIVGDGWGCTTDRDLPSASPTGRLLLSLLVVGAGATFLARRRRFGA
jgi:hypothetical protein